MAVGGVCCYYDRLRLPRATTAYLYGWREHTNTKQMSPSTLMTVSRAAAGSLSIFSFRNDSKKEKEFHLNIKTYFSVKPA